MKKKNEIIKSLSIKPNDPYVLNYLGYGWLEREYKIQDAIGMLDKAYNQKKNDPFIIDSVGWGYYPGGDTPGSISDYRRIPSPCTGSGR